MIQLNMYLLGVKQQRFIHYFLYVVLLPNSNDTCVWMIYIVLYLLIQSGSISITVRGYTTLLRSNYHLHFQTCCTYLFHNFNLDTKDSLIQCILCITLFIVDFVASLRYKNIDQQDREAVVRYRYSLHLCWAGGVNYRFILLVRNIPFITYQVNHSAIQNYII